MWKRQSHPRTEEVGSEIFTVLPGEDAKAKSIVGSWVGYHSRAGMEFSETLLGEGI